MIKIDPTTEKNVNNWLNSNIDEASKNAIKKMQKENPKELIDAFYTQLSFGTGGLRGIMGVGTNRLNQYTIQMATQGLANYINSQCKEGSVFIGYDSRVNSRFFAETSSKVLAANGIRAYLCAELRPTPLVSFGCRNKKCSAAIMITASHNPPEYNGYKVYWQDGGQVVPPHDTGIIEEVKKITEPSQIKMVENLSHPLISIVKDEVDNAYIDAIKNLSFYPEENKTHGSSLKIAYTSLHGTGFTLIPKALEAWGFDNITLVEKQCIPDGSFPTVKSPNPEEREALSLGIETIKKEKSDLLIATDPDADRMGIAFLIGGEPVLLNGNQIACVCLYHICEALKSKNQITPKDAFVKTIATTELFKKIALSYGAICVDVLTGFKYIGEKIGEWEKETDGPQYIFGGEESYGYLLGTHARDKDAAISAALIAEVALHAKLKGQTLIDVLDEIFTKFGVFTEKLLSLKFEDSKEGKEHIANEIQKLQNNPPKEFLGVPVQSLEDYQKGIKKDLKSGKEEKLTLPKSNNLLFWLEDGTKLLIRPSGTEPKIKIYCGIEENQGQDLKIAKESADKRASDYLNELKRILSAE